MVYFKLLLLDKRPKADNIYSIVVRLTYNRANTTLTTGLRVRSDLWDANTMTVKRNHPNSQVYNKTITDFYSKVQNISFQLMSEGSFSFDGVKHRMATDYEPPKINKSTPFNEYAQTLIKDMLTINQTGNAIVYQTAANRLMAYVDKPNLRFTDITYNLLEGFKRHLLIGGMKQNTVSNYFRTLRAIYNKAIKAKLVDRTHYPFLDITIKTERTAKRAISINALRDIANHELKPKSRHWHARNYFLLSFALIGASFTDLAYLTSDNIKKGRLIYKRRKTGKELSINLQAFTEKLLVHYEGMNAKYLLPVLPSGVTEDSMDAKRAISQWIKTTNKWLGRITADCKIEDEVTTYVARHTWATTAKRLGYSIELIAEAMGHEHGNKITNIYLDSFDQNIIDEMNETVIQTIIK
jgi:integrase/recombinase XerD